MKAVLSDCNSVLEPGCGFGWELRLVDRPVMVGIEAHKPYLDDARCVKDPRIAYIHGEAIVVMRKMVEDKKKFDAVMMIDFIEHLDKKDAVTALNLSEQIAVKKVWLWVPVGHHPQDHDFFGLGGERWQTHRSEWHPGDLIKLGYDVATWPDHHSPKNAKGEARSRGAMFALKVF